MHQKLVEDDKQAVSDRGGRSIGTPSRCQAAVLSFEVAVLGAASGAGSLGQRATQPAVAFGGGRAFSDAGRLLIAGQIPAHDAKCPAVGKRLISVPISATTFSIVRWLTPGIASRRSKVALSRKGSMALSICWFRSSSCPSRYCR